MKRVKLFGFYNDVGRKYPASKLLYKAGAAKKRELFIKRLLVEGTPKNKSSFLTLDVGCADGYYKKHILNYVGVDIARGYLMRFNGRRVWSEAQHLPFKDCVFRRVLLSEVLEHVWERKQVLDECYRVLQDKGTLIFSAPYGKNAFHIQKDWQMLGKYGVDYCPYVHGHFSPQYIRRLLGNSKFRVLWLKVLTHKGKRRYSVALAIKE